MFFCGAIIKKKMEQSALQGRFVPRKREILEVNAGQWTRIIVEVDPRMRWIGQQKSLRSPSLLVESGLHPQGAGAIFQ